MSDPADAAADEPVFQTTTADERAAMRGFLQRCEVRLSTMHRVATALLSGAGILVLLPAVERDSILQVLRALLVGPVTWSRGLLAVSMGLAIFLALAVLWILIIEMTRFYFHANHVVEGDREVFTPRFTLTGLRISSDELGSASNAAYEAVHAEEGQLRLLVPGNDRARARIDRQLNAYPGLVNPDIEPDAARSQAMFGLAASSRRPLVEEVAKIEYGMVRHMLRLQVIVLRYVKALLVIVITAIAAFAAAAAVDGRPSLTAADERWIAGTMVLWAPIVLIVVSSPVRWLQSVLRSEGAERTGMQRDPELTRLDTITARVGFVAHAVSLAAMVLLLVNHPVSSQGRVAVVIVIAVSSVLVSVALVQRYAGTHEQAAQRLAGATAKVHR